MRTSSSLSTAIFHIYIYAVAQNINISITVCDMCVFFKVPDSSISQCKVEDDFPNKEFMNATTDKTVGEVEYLEKK